MTSYNSIELIDCHTHTVFSDGNNTLEETVRAARKKGITTLACTDHWGRPEFIDCSISAEKLSAYEQEIAYLQEQHPDIDILLGYEADWYEGCEQDLLQTCAHADFVLGSVHYLNKLAIDWDKDMRIWEQLGADAVWHLYVEQWCQAATSELFDSMAHPDLPRLFSTHGYAPSFDCTPLWKIMAEAAYEGGVHIEINTAGLLKGFNDYYPNKDLLCEFQKAGIPITVGSDAHTSQRIGDHILEAYLYAQSCGYTSCDVPCGNRAWRSISFEML